MLQPYSTSMWVGVAVVLAIVVVLLVVAAIRSRRNRPSFDVRPLPADRVDQFATRFDELERRFVTSPREAVAEARQQVDEMLALMGYPARLRVDERARDVAHMDRGRGRRYQAAASVDDRSTTEEMRRALNHFLAMGRELLAESRSASGRSGITREPREAPMPARAEPPAGTTAQSTPEFERTEPSAERGERRLT